MMEEVYVRKWYLGKEEKFGECKGVGRWVWRKIGDRSKKNKGNRREIEDKDKFKSREV